MYASKEAALSPVENNSDQIRIKEKQNACLEFSLLKNIAMFSTTLYVLPYDLFLDETFFPNDLLMVACSLDLSLEPSGTRLPDRKVELVSSGVSSQGGKCW